MSIRSQYPQLNDRDWLYQHYAVLQRSAVEIAETIGCHRGAVTRALRRFEIPTVRRGPSRLKIPLLNNRVALAQRVQTTPLRVLANELGCSYSAVHSAIKRHGIVLPHRDTYRMTVNKSEAVKRGLQKKHPDGRYGPNAGNWKGGRLVRNGYIVLHRDLVAKRWPNHPRLALPDWTHKQEHILVMEAHLGRCLKKGEEVHHGPSGKQDNRIGNLTLMASRSEHQTAEWANVKHANWLHGETLNLKQFIVHKGIALDEYYAWQREQQAT